MATLARPGLRHRPLGVDLTAAVALAVVAALAGYAAITYPSSMQLMIIIPFALWLLANRFLAAMLMALTLAYVADVSGGATGLNLALSDVLMTFFVVTLALQWFVTERAPELTALRPLKVVVGQYVAVMAVLLVAHLGVMELIKTGQRIELFLFPMIVGAALVRMGREYWVLRAYVVGASLAAALWIAGIELGQKNPTGQFMANGVILLMASKEVRRRLIWLLPLLAAGLLWTQSRGAILSVGIGLVGLLLTQSQGRRIRSTLLIAPLAVASYAAFQLLPEQAQARNLSYTSGDESAASWAIKIRQQYQVDAWNLIHANPGTGIGIGQYRAGSGFQGTFTTDPHQVLLLQVAEGGYGLALSFVLLIVGTLAVVWVVARRTPLGAAAVALMAGIVGHGMVDVYWVRGTPVLGWLLVGMALAQRRRTDAEPTAAQQRPLDVLA